MSAAATAVVSVRIRFLVLPRNGHPHEIRGRLNAVLLGPGQFLLVRHAAAALPARVSTRATARMMHAGKWSAGVFSQVAWQWNAGSPGQHDPCHQKSHGSFEVALEQIVEPTDHPKSNPGSVV